MTCVRAAGLALKHVDIFNGLVAANLDVKAVGLGAVLLVLHDVLDCDNFVAFGVGAFDVQA